MSDTVSKEVYEGLLIAADFLGGENLALREQIRELNDYINERDDLPKRIRAFQSRDDNVPSILLRLVLSRIQDEISDKMPCTKKDGDCIACQMLEDLETLTGQA